MSKIPKVRNGGYLILWWTNGKPYATWYPADVKDAEIDAELYADPRNAVVLSISGRDLDFLAVDDWFRRDADGRPMPFEWRTPRPMIGRLPTL